MGKPEREGRCRRHPSHKHSNGVCPYCLRDRLTNISTSSASSTANALSSTASSTIYSYDSDASSAATPPPEKQPRTNMSLSHLIKGSKSPLRKSSSFAGAFPKEAAERPEKEKKNKKTKGMKFLAKLLIAKGGRRKEREGGLFHSKTVKEKPSSKWTFFS